MNNASLAITMLMATASLALAVEPIWIEGEIPTIPPPASCGWKTNPTARPDWLSGGTAFFLGIDADDLATRLPAPVTVGYAFAAPTGTRAVWARIGFEFVRSPFDWRIDDGAWTMVEPTELTCDLMGLATWNEIAWLKLGEAALSAGQHRIEFRHSPRTVPEKDKAVPQRVLHLLDCIALTDPGFVPNGKFKPGEFPATTTDTFRLPVPASHHQRVTLPLHGQWAIARWDEQVIDPATRLTMPEQVPTDLDQHAWWPIDVPGAKEDKRPELQLAHRTLYRTRFEVPKELAGRGVVFSVADFNMIIAVYVNGRRMGWSKDCQTAWQCDLTPAIKAGGINDLVVAFKDCYYAITNAKDPLFTRRSFNQPFDTLGEQYVTRLFDMPVGGYAARRTSGFLDTPQLTVVGPVWVSDVFAKPSVSRKELGLEVSVSNPGSKPVAVSIDNIVVPAAGGAVAKTFAGKTLNVPANGTARLDLSEGWADPVLWWPDQPHLYRVETVVKLDGTPIDAASTRFGFREWSWTNSTRFSLNGVPWSFKAVADYGKSLAEYQAWCATSGQNTLRIFGPADQIWGLPHSAMLPLCDEQGIVVRYSGIFDGQIASYALVQNKQVNRALFDNWHSQLAAWTRAARNHPSIFIWSIENEITYINSANLGWSKLVEPEIRTGAAIVEALDPTRPTMVDGGRALVDQSMPVNGLHYNEFANSSPRDYPDIAYATDHLFADVERNLWPMKRNAPIFHAEDSATNFADGRYAFVGGEATFGGPIAAIPGQALFNKMFSEGCRWTDRAGFHLWTYQAGVGRVSAWQPVAVLCRQWNWSFGSGATVQRTGKVFNDTRCADPIEVRWQVTVDGKQVTDERKTFALAPGANQEFTWEFTLPSTAAARTAGVCTCTAVRNGREVFREDHPLVVLNGDAGPKPFITAVQLAVIDPQGAASARLKARGVPFTPVADLAAVPSTATTLLVGTDAVGEAESSSPAWLALAAKGVKVLVLEQRFPLRYQALPADLDPTDWAGRIAFAEDLGHPALAGLDQPDFFCLGNDHVVYRHAYRKGVRGFRSLLQCDDHLTGTALAECPAGSGLLLLCQVPIGAKLASEAVAQRLFDNLVAYAAAYVPEVRPTTTVMTPTGPAAALLARIGLKGTAMTDPVAALQQERGVAVIEATPANLATLAAKRSAVDAFTATGGWLMLWGLTPEGLQDYNAIVGVDHMIRRCDFEKVELALPRDPLLSGLSLRDVVMDDGTKIFSYASIKMPVDDGYTYAVDHDEAGRFLSFPTPEAMGKAPGSAKKTYDHWPQNLVNGYVGDDCWRFVYSINLDRGHVTEWDMELPAARSIDSIGIAISTLYHTITQVALTFDDSPTPLVLELKPAKGRQDFPLPTPRTTKRIHLKILDWIKGGKANVLGIDNLWFGIARDPAWLKANQRLLNIGTLLRYNRGAGGIVLNQINAKESEANPVNAQKKATVVAALLRNLHADFGRSDLAVVGDQLVTTPVTITKQGVFNAYQSRDKTPGWFADLAKADLAHLPTGAQRLGGVDYFIDNFATSPVPGVVMLAGTQSKTTDKAVAGIPVERSADSLFFLHTACASPKLRQWEKSRKKPDAQPPIVFQYVVHYQDGSTAEIPVRWGQDVGHWYQPDPKGLMNAVVAWKAPFPGGDGKQQAVLYGLQWNNPRPAAPIASIDLCYGEDGEVWGTPALFGITTGTIRR